MFMDKGLFKGGKMKGLWEEKKQGKEKTQEKKGERESRFYINISGKYYQGQII